MESLWVEEEAWKKIFASRHKLKQENFSPHEKSIFFVDVTDGLDGKGGDVSKERGMTHS